MKGIIFKNYITNTNKDLEQAQHRKRMDQKLDYNKGQNKKYFI